MTFDHVQSGHHVRVPISHADVNELIELMDAGRQSWITGNLAYSARMDVQQDRDMTIFGPFGGEALRGESQLAERQPQAARLFAGGRGHCEVVKTIVEGSLVVVIMIERSEVQLVGRDDVQRWDLRTTSVFRRVDETWVRLHRHADPLRRFRPPAETFALADG